MNSATPAGSSWIAQSAPRLSGSPAFGIVSTKIKNNMSGVSAGRLGTLIRMMMLPWSSFDTAVVVMSGAAGSSPTESLNVWEFAATPAEPPSAIAGVTTSAASASPSTTVLRVTPAIYPLGERPPRSPSV